MSETRFIHAYVAGGGRATVAWKHYEAGSSANVHVGVAWCSPKDHFRKDKGRLVATGRLDKCPVWLLVDLTERNGRKFIAEQSVLNNLVQYNEQIHPSSRKPRWAENKALFIPSREAVKVSA